MHVNISAEDIDRIVNYRYLVQSLHQAFASDDYRVPERMHLNLPHGKLSLVMPAWNRKYYGLKQIIVCPENKSKQLPTILGRYDLFNIRNGQQLASFDAPKLTAVRTAATSVLASSFMVNNPKRHLIIGNGVIGKHLQKAFGAYYEELSSIFYSRSLERQVNLQDEVYHADIVSCATLASEPIVYGQWVNAKTHFDLVGSYKPDMREADDELIKMADLYIDDYQALKESGDLAIPLQNGVISRDSIQSTLFELCKRNYIVKKTSHPTLFKSVGHAIEDLSAAIYIYESL